MWELNTRVFPHSNYIQPWERRRQLNCPRPVVYCFLSWPASAHLLWVQCSVGRVATQHQGLILSWAPGSWLCKTREACYQKGTWYSCWCLWSVTCSSIMKLIGKFTFTNYTLFHFVVTFSVINSLWWIRKRCFVKTKFSKFYTCVIKTWVNDIRILDYITVIKYFSKSI